jgi:hypothetical protein
MADFWNDALGVLGAVAPTIATAFGGPLVGQAVTFVAKAMGLSPDASKAEVAEAIAKATPEQLLAIKKADNEFAAHMGDLGVELDRIAAGDRANARAMQIETKSVLPAVLAAAVVVGYFGVTFVLMKWGLPAEGGEALLILLGGLNLGFGAVLNFYFGSSAGSADKTRTIATLASK